MPADGSWRLLLPAPVRRLPADLAAVAALCLVTIGAVFVPAVNETPLRIVLGLPFVLFLPGYAFIAALFPEAGPKRSAAAGDEDVPVDEAETGGGILDRGGIDGIERVALSFGTSIAIVPLLGLGLNFTPWGIRLAPIMVAVSGFTLGAVAVAAKRRWELPPAERFAVPYRRWLAAGRAELFEPETRTDSVLNVLLICSLVLALGSIGYAIAVPPDGERFSEVYLLTEGEDGELVADGYPESFVAGEGQSLVVGVGNQEHEETTYTVVAELHRVEFLDGGNETEVVERERLQTFETTLGHNETWQLDHEIAPTMTGEELRVTYMLYRGAPPDSPTPENAYRSVHLWVDVEESSARVVVR
ncbi:DUF1616 domain-containing protein [Haloferacaceae archaeon DSL9]